MTDAARFDIPDCPQRQVDELRGRLGVSAALAQVLVRRGHGDPAVARAFLAADERHDPFAFAGMEQAVGTIRAHVAGGARITIHGDYDVDGICSTAVLVRCLRALGADVDWYLPDRIADGYGLSSQTVQRLAGRGTRLLVTVDCAITAVEQVAEARALGMDVVVTDHHAPRADGALPDCPIVHPAVCGYPCADLCATAVAYKLALALTSACDGDRVAHAGDAPLGGPGHSPESDLDLVALATIADMVALLGENRRLAREGLRALATTAKPGLRALMSVSRVHAGRVDERAVGFSLAPRLNAAGRLHRADAGLELLLTDDPLRAAQIADELDRANHERRQTEMRIRHEAEAQIAELAKQDGGDVRGAYVLAGEGWHPGVVGIVASRLAERHNRPVVVLCLEGERGRGSGRSIDGFDLLGGLRECADQLTSFGGHRAAAGVELQRGRVQEFAAALDEHARLMLEGMDLSASERVDAIVEGGQLGMELAEELTRMAPFGMGNPSISLMLAGALFSDGRAMGEGKHVRFTVQSAGARSRAVAFGGGGSLPVEEGVAADATFTLEVNEYRGVSEPRLVLRRLRETQAEPLVRRAPSAAAIVAERIAEEPPAVQSPSGELVLF